MPCAATLRHFAGRTFPFKGGWVCALGKALSMPPQTRWRQYSLSSPMLGRRHFDLYLLLLLACCGDVILMPAPPPQNTSLPHYLLTMACRASLSCLPTCHPSSTHSSGYLASAAPHLHALQAFIPPYLCAHIKAWASRAGRSSSPRAAAA